MNYNTLATQDSINTTVKSLESKNIRVAVLENGKEALNKIIQIIPQGASVMNGASVTLEQIGYIDYLKSGNHGWKNLHEEILAEKDPVKQAALRRQSVLSDYYLGSVHALLENGEFIIASNTGSQLPNIVFTSPNLIFVVSTKKIVSNFEEAMKRVEEHIIPLEDARMKKAYGVGTALNKLLVFKNENPMLGRKVYILLVKEDLGF